MAKIDLKNELRELYYPSAKQVTTVNVPVFNFLMIDGEGDPNTSQQYKEAVEALFSVSYAIKFMLKKGRGIDYGVMPLEGLWWADDMKTFSLERKEGWKWTSVIMQPNHVSAEEVALGIEQTRKKKGLKVLSTLRFESYPEGLAAQIMHIGPFSTEQANIKKIHEYILNSGHTLVGKHHEIYLSDPRKTDPEKLKTILRQPMK